VPIDASAPKSEVAERIWTVVMSRLDPEAAPMMIRDAAR
jgi:hypothetical protein